MFSKNEKLLNDYPKPIFIKQTEIILRQMKNSVCRVNCKDGSKGSGFFCKIPISHYKDLPVFVTANHVIDENYLNKENKIILEIDDGTKNHIKNLTLNDKFKYTSKKYDITIIEINE